MEVEDLNINKIFPEDKKDKKGITGFLEKHGFLIVLAICILIIGASAAYVAMDNFSEPEFGMDEGLTKASPDRNSGVESSSNEEERLNSLEMPTATAKPAIANEATPVPTLVRNTATPAPKATAKANLKQNLFMPVLGQITAEFARTRLIYSKTMEDWRTHSGVDIAADRGTLVKAAADGTVCDIKNDPGLGVTVIIDHGSGYKTVYANLAAGDMVAVNQVVKQGENIGSVGNTANYEAAEQSHLHFGLLENGDAVDPAKFLPKLN